MINDEEDLTNLDCIPFLTALDAPESERISVKKMALVLRVNENLINNVVKQSVRIIRWVWFIFHICQYVICEKISVEIDLFFCLHSNSKIVDKDGYHVPKEDTDRFKTLFPVSILFMIQRNC